MRAFPSLSELKAVLQGAPAITRFAPSPTGYLHLGHVVNALYVWGIAKALGGEVILRLEDHDRTRCKPEYELALLEDLEFLGLHADRGLSQAFRAGPSDYRQSDWGQHYQAALEKLDAQGLVYACDCSRQAIRQRTGQAEGEELRYDGHCRNRGLAAGPGMTIRVQLKAEEVHFVDALQGPQQQRPWLDCGDVAVRDRNGCWTYQFAVVVDDLRHEVNLVIRGNDLLSSTGRQLLLMQALGADRVSVYLHHGLLVDENGRKLSKRDFDADIHSLFLAGADPKVLMGKAAHLCGLQKSVRALDLEGVVALFREGGT